MRIEVNHLSCSYPETAKRSVRALEDVSFTIEAGEFVGVMGRTGCGKSTLIQLIAGLLPPTEGEILIDGESIFSPRYDRARLRELVGVVFQNPEYQLFETTVEKDVAFSLKHQKLSKAEKQSRVQWALEVMGFDFEAIRQKSPLALSGGEKRRVAIAGVLAAKPKLLIFDEPIAGLDPLGREAFLHLAKTLNRFGVTILMVSHQADALCECAGRILVLEDGRLAADGPPEEIFRNLDAARRLHIGAGNARRIAQGLFDSGCLPAPYAVTYDGLLQGILTARKGGEGQ